MSELIKTQLELFQITNQDKKFLKVVRNNLKTQKELMIQTSQLTQLKKEISSELDQITINSKVVDMHKAKRKKECREGLKKIADCFEIIDEQLINISYWFEINKRYLYQIPYSTR